MLDLSWSNILQSNTFNFTIMIALFAFIAHKIKVSQKIEDHRASIQKNIDDSDLFKKTAEEELKNVSKSLENLPHELESIIQKAEKTAKAFEEKTKEDTNKLIESMKQNTDKQLQADEKFTNSSILKNVSLASVDIAQKQVQKALESNKDLHRKFINEFIDEIDRLEI